MKKPNDFLSMSLPGVLLLGLVATVAVSALPISPVLDVTLSSWQMDVTTGQETFSLTGPGVLLTGTGYDEGQPLSQHDAYFPVGGQQQYGFNASFGVSNGHGGSFAEGTVDGVTYTASSPLGIYEGGPFFLTGPFSLPSGTNPLVTLPVSVSGISLTPAAMFGCTPDCITPDSIPFQFNFLSSSGSVQLQFAGPDIDAYTLESFNLTASPSPEPASYASAGVGLLLLCLCAAGPPEVSAAPLILSALLQQATRSVHAMLPSGIRLQ